MVDVVVDVEGRGFDEELLAIVAGPELVTAIADALYARWVQIAHERLTKSRDAYLAGLRPPTVTEAGATIELKGDLANYVEDGSPAYDMKAAFLKGAPYRVIAFGHGGAAPALGYGLRAQLGADARSLGRNVAKKAARATRGAAGGRLAAGTAPRMPGHQTDIYAGLQKRGKGAGSQYLTFRTISENSAGWQNPGIAPRRIAEEVLEELDDITSTVLDAAFEALGEGLGG